mmetsp:Transcript_41993/g.75399  ORF Transcript_41993/g.75399 Transcript_41993/m.75399 type:complete len:117 (+) Transcript_41993:1124-1474(+)
MAREARNKKRKRKASGGSSRRPSSKHDLSNVTVILESEMLPDLRKYMKKDEERGERKIELLTEIGHGMKGLAEAQKEIAVDQKDMTAAHERMCNIQNQTRTLLGMMIQHMQHGKGN